MSDNGLVAQSCVVQSHLYCGIEVGTGHRGEARECKRQQNAKLVEAMAAVAILFLVTGGGS